MAEKYRHLFKYAEASFWTNLVIAIGKLITGIFAMSFFLCVNALYNFGVAGAKKIAVNTNNSVKNNLPNERDVGRQKVFKSYLLMGIIVLIATGAYLVGSIRLFLGNDTTQYTLVVALAIATFTFTELTMSIIGFIKTRKSNKPLMEAVKLTTFASALISLPLTQTALLSISAESDFSFYNGIASIIFGCLAGLIGLYMVLHAINILSGKYEKFLMAITKSTLKRYGLKAVKFVDESQTLYVAFDDSFNKANTNQNNENLSHENSITKDLENAKNSNLTAKNSNLTPINLQHNKQNYNKKIKKSEIKNYTKDKKFATAKQHINHLFRINLILIE